MKKEVSFLVVCGMLTNKLEIYMTTKKNLETLNVKVSNRQMCHIPRKIKKPHFLQK